MVGMREPLPQRRGAERKIHTYFERKKRERSVETGPEVVEVIPKVRRLTDDVTTGTPAPTPLCLPGKERCRELQQEVSLSEEGKKTPKAHRRPRRSKKEAEMTTMRKISSFFDILPQKPSTVKEGGGLRGGGQLIFQLTHPKLTNWTEDLSWLKQHQTTNTI